MRLTIWIGLALTALGGGTSHALTDVMGNVKQNGFGARTLVLTSFCSAGQICAVADFSGDRFADLVALDPVLRRVRFARNVTVGTGFTVSSQLHDAVRPNRAFAWGDSNAEDSRDDLFVCDNLSGTASLFRATASNTLETTARPVATSFCRTGEQFRAGDVNGDGLADAVRFHMSATMPAGRVMIALNMGSAGFAAPTEWQPFFGINDEQVSVADLDGDRSGDVVTCVPNAGAYIALSNDTTQFFNPRRPRVGIGMASRLPELTDFAATGQTCLTGDFDGGGKHDLVVFTQGAGGFIHEFHDTRGDVYVSLSHTMFDFTDFFRAGRPRIRHEDFCRTGEQCAVGDLNRDGRDDIISFAHGAGGSSQVNVAFSRWGVPTTWNLDLMSISARRTEGSSDKPLILALGFRSTFGSVGSTVIRRNAYNETFATGIVAGGRPINIPADVGKFPFSVRLRTLDNLLGGSGRPTLEIYGVVVVVMEKDLSAAAAYSGLMDEATRALHEVLVQEVERRPVISALTSRLLSGGTASLGALLQDNMQSALDDVLHLFITGIFDPDDYINLHVAVFPALDKEFDGFVPATGDSHASVGVPGESFFGVSLGMMPFNDGDSPLWYDVQAMFR